MILDYVIIGGGISGLAFARLLQLSAVDRFLVLEAEAQPGGLCRTREIQGHVLDVGGGHFLGSRFPEVYAFLFQHLPKEEFNLFRRISKVRVEGHTIDYPLEGNLWQLPQKLCAKYLLSLSQSGEAQGLPAPAHFEAWIRWKLGHRMAEMYMLPYNRKLWGIAPAELDIDWLHKLPRMDLAEIRRACVTQSSDRSVFPSHETFHYPKHGGFQRLCDALLAPIRDHVACGEPVHRIERQGEVSVLNGCHRARRVINTAPWATLRESPVFDVSTRIAIDRLRASPLVVSLHEDAPASKAHWFYEPDEKVAHHRLFSIHNFAPDSKQGGCFRETNGTRWRSNGELAAVNNAYAYPMPIRGWARDIRTILDQCEPRGIFGLGRWGQWQHFNSDVCVHEAMGLARRLGHGGWDALATGWC